MKRVKSIVSSMVLMGVIMMGVSNARAGLVMSDFRSSTENNPCVEQNEKPTDNVDHGIIVHDLVGIATAVFESIFGKSDGQTNCGIIVHD